MREHSRPVARLLLIAAWVGSANRAAAGALPRTDDVTAVAGLANPPLTTGWVTQEWPQRGQNAVNDGLYSAPFTQGTTFQCKFAPAFREGNGKFVQDPPYADITGELASEFFIGSRPLGPGGLGFIFTNPRDPKTDALSPLLEIGTLNTTSPGPPAGSILAQIQMSYSCGMVGTPIVIPYELGGGQSVAFVLGATGMNCNQSYEGGLVEYILLIAGTLVLNTSTTPPTQTPTYTILGYQRKEVTLGPVEFSPAYDGTVNVYLATRGLANNFGAAPRASKVSCVDWVTMNTKWTSTLQIGGGGGEQAPKGAPPPPSPQSFYACTSPACDGTLVIVAGQEMDISDSGIWGNAYPTLLSNSVMFALDPLSGKQKWTYEVTGARIMPNPVLLPDLVIFGTDDGRAFALNRTDGSVRWQTPSGLNIKAPQMPFNYPEVLSNVALSGPAVDQSLQYAFFGGTDGRIHRFSVQGGSWAASNVLLYTSPRVGLDSQNGPWELDGNGYRIFRAAGIYTPPVVEGSQFVAVKCESRYAPQDRYVTGPVPFGRSNVFTLVSPNEAYVAVAKCSDLSFNPTVYQGFFSTCSNNSNGVQVNAARAVFETCNGDAGIIPMVGASGTFPPEPMVMDYDRVFKINYVAWPGFNGSDFPLFPAWSTPPPSWGLPWVADSGGVSLTNGLLVATDTAGDIVGIPSSLSVGCSGAVSGVGTFTGPLPPPVMPPPLGPIQAYPNPYLPDVAINGMFKFRNLPAGSIVDLFTLAYEQVKELHEVDHSADWDGRNAAGQPVATGVYLYRIKIPDQATVKGRIALVRR